MILCVWYIFSPICQSGTNSLQILILEAFGISLSDFPMLNCGYNLCPSSTLLTNSYGHFIHGNECGSRYCVVAKSAGSGTRLSRFKSHLSPPKYVTLDKLLTLSMSQFPYLQSGNDKNTYLLELLGRFKCNLIFMELSIVPGPWNTCFMTGTMLGWGDLGVSRQS